MKKILLILFGLLILAIFAGTAIFLYQKSQQKPVVYQTAQAEVRDIIKKTIATGKIVPRKEVDVKSQVSGVVDKVFVEAGETINKGELIAKIQIIPNVERLNAAESRVQSAKISFEDAARELDRQKSLFENKLISEVEYRKYLLEYNLKQESLSSAESNLAIVREGASKKAGQVSNLVNATLSGMILDVPVKEGHFITETNTFNAGTTIATIANMQDLIFEGTVDESEVGKIAEGMELVLNIGALESEKFTANLEYISPKGVDDQGTIKFAIKAAVSLQEGTFLRAGYSANADIVLDKREQVIALNERYLQFDNKTPYVEVETTPQTFERREITTGLSDGIFIEIISGISTEDKIKEPIIGH